MIGTSDINTVTSPLTNTLVLPLSTTVYMVRKTVPVDTTDWTHTGLSGGTTQRASPLPPAAWPVGTHCPPLLPMPCHP
jgi:hypothetical protein